MLTPGRFLESANHFLDVTVEQAAIDEIRTINYDDIMAALAQPTFEYTMPATWQTVIPAVSTMPLGKIVNEGHPIGTLPLTTLSPVANLGFGIKLAAGGGRLIEFRFRQFCQIRTWLSILTSTR